MRQFAESGPPDDLITGDEGDDVLIGGPGDDNLKGDEGNDRGGGGNDTIDDGPGADLILGDEVQVDTTLFDRSEFGPGGVSNQTPLGAVPIDLSSGQAAGFTLHEGDLAELVSAAKI